MGASVSAHSVLWYLPVCASVCVHAVGVHVVCFVRAKLCVAAVAMAEIWAGGGVAEEFVWWDRVCGWLCGLSCALVCGVARILVCVCKFAAGSSSGCGCLWLRAAGVMLGCAASKSLSGCAGSRICECSAPCERAGGAVRGPEPMLVV